MQNIVSFIGLFCKRSHRSHVSSVVGRTEFLHTPYHIYMYTHTCTHTHTHTHTHAHTLSPFPPFPISLSHTRPYPVGGQIEKATSQNVSNIVGRREFLHTNISYYLHVYIYIHIYTCKYIYIPHTQTHTHARTHTRRYPVGGQIEKATAHVSPATPVVEFLATAVAKGRAT